MSDMKEIHAKLQAALAQRRQKIVEEIIQWLQAAQEAQATYDRAMADVKEVEKLLSILRQNGGDSDSNLCQEAERELAIRRAEMEPVLHDIRTMKSEAHQAVDRLVALGGDPKTVEVPGNVQEVYRVLLHNHRASAPKPVASSASSGSQVNILGDAMERARGIQVAGNGLAKVS